MKNTAITFLLLLGYFTPLPAQTDTIPPTIVCKQNLIETNLIPPFGMISLWAESYMYDTLYDNASTNLEIGLRKVCMGTGFPEESSSITFS